MFQILVTTGPLVLLAGLIAVVAIYVMHRSTSGGPRVALKRYAALTLGAGIAGFCAGSALGIGIACFSTNASNLCGLVGIFGLGPLLSGAAMVLTAVLLIRRQH